ncbi:MAG: hypothetical protein E6G62_07490 [Actinobacteria bacterium]|nr:MAG: hypothetical protein E6G62_07490 [Actinomycetota bacterium]
MAVAELRAQEPRPAASLNPFRVRGTALPPNVLLAAKIVTLVFLVTGGWRLTSPFVPFVGFLGDIASQATFQHTLQALWLIAAASLLLNQLVRPSCLILGGTLLLAQLSSMAYRTNNLTFTALLLLMIGLSDRNTAKLLIRAQLVVLYFWAGTNKLLDANWRSGAFFESWVGIHAYGPAYKHLADLLPSMVLSTIASWAAILTELFISVTFAIRRLVPMGILLVIAYHSSLFLVTGTTFTMFWFSLTAACVALVDWPAVAPTVKYGEAARFGRIAHLLERIDLGHAFAWERSDGAELELVSGEERLRGRDALARVLLYHPTIYLAFYALAAIQEPARRWAAAVALAVAAYAAVQLVSAMLNSRSRVTRVTAPADVP